MWEGTSSRVRKNDYVPLGTYQNNNLENFGGGPVQYLKKIPYSNFLGRTSQKKHPALIFILLGWRWCSVRKPQSATIKIWDTTAQNLKLVFLGTFKRSSLDSKIGLQKVLILQFFNEYQNWLLLKILQYTNGFKIYFKPIINNFLKGTILWNFFFSCPEQL